MAEPPRKKIVNPDKVAVATDSGTCIDACFGRVKEFRIYGAGPEGYRLLEIRPALAPCRDKNHDLSVLNRTAELLSDCQLVLAGRIGPAALGALADRGVMGLAVHLPIDEALTKLARP
jgi:predicted Fe-Mo cluster-binding NifX family protein